MPISSLSCIPILFMLLHVIVSHRSMSLWGILQYFYVHQTEWYNLPILKFIDSFVWWNIPLILHFHYCNFNCRNYIWLFTIIYFCWCSLFGKKLLLYFSLVLYTWFPFALWTNFKCLPTLTYELSSRQHLCNVFHCIGQAFLYLACLILQI